jgi:hypothetical protein
VDVPQQHVQRECSYVQGSRCLLGQDLLEGPLRRARLVRRARPRWLY